MDLAIKVANVNKKYRLGTINWRMIKKDILINEQRAIY